MKRLILLSAITMIVVISLGSMENQLAQNDKYASQVDRAGPETLLTSSNPVNITPVEGMDMGIAMTSVSSNEAVIAQVAAVAVEANSDQIGSKGLQGYSFEGSSLPLKTLMLSEASNTEGILSSYELENAEGILNVTRQTKNVTGPESNLNSLRT